MFLSLANYVLSGSESVKFRKGRGLRLPVDENGHRVHQKQWSVRLSFLIGYDEKRFASMLVDGISLRYKVQLNEQKLDEAMIANSRHRKRQKSIRVYGASFAGRSDDKN